MFGLVLSMKVSLFSLFLITSSVSIAMGFLVDYSFTGEGGVFFIASLPELFHVCYINLLNNNSQIIINEGSSCILRDYNSHSGTVYSARQKFVTTDPPQSNSFAKFAANNGF